jgi:hypothetical protein
LDLMFLGKRKPVLHVKDSGKTFNAATFIKGESSAEIWNALLQCWSGVYCGDPQEILTDSGTAFCSEEFHNLCEQHDIIIRHTPIEQHNALGQGEQFHCSLRRTFNKVSLDYPNVPREVLLQLAVYALNTSANAHGLVPCFLVFGTLQRLPFVSETDPVSNSDRFKILSTAREEYERHIAEQIIACGLKTKVPSATDVIYKTGYSVYVYRDEAKRWTGPFVVQEVDWKSLQLIVDSKGPKPFSITRCKLAVFPYDDKWTEDLEPTDPR